MTKKGGCFVKNNARPLSEVTSGQKKAPKRRKSKKQLAQTTARQKNLYYDQGGGCNW